MQFVIDITELMEFTLFVVFSFVMLMCGLLVVVNRNPVASALCLAMCFGMVAGLFLLLEAFFLSVVQILVYAGAVMVLFLFIVMLLDLKVEKRRKIKLQGIFAGVIVTVFFFILCQQFAPLVDNAPMPHLTQRVNDVKSLGHLLYSEYMLPFLIVGLILLVATVGVVHVSRKEVKIK